MAMVLCPEHGMGCAAVCSHVAELVCARAPIRQSRIPVYASYTGHVLGPTWLCAGCAARFGVPEEGLTLTGEAGFDIFWAEIDWKPVCPGCYDACRMAGD